MSGIRTPRSALSVPFQGSSAGAALLAAQPPALAPLMLVKRRAVDLCRVDSCLCRCS